MQRAEQMCAILLALPVLLLLFSSWLFFLLLLLARASLKWLPVPSHTSFVCVYFSLYKCVCVCICDMVISQLVCVYCSIHYRALFGPSDCLAAAYAKLCTAFAFYSAFPCCFSFSFRTFFSMCIWPKGDEILQLNLFQQISANKMMKLLPRPFPFSSQNLIQSFSFFMINCQGDVYVY